MTVGQSGSARFRDAPPKAAAMVEALRGLGYTTETALADWWITAFPPGREGSLSISIGLDWIAGSRLPMMGAV